MLSGPILANTDTNLLTDLAVSSLGASGLFVVCSFTLLLIKAHGHLPKGQRSSYATIALLGSAVLFSSGALLQTLPAFFPGFIGVELALLASLGLFTAANICSLYLYVHAMHGFNNKSHPAFANLMMKVGILCVFLLFLLHVQRV